MTKSTVRGIFGVYRSQFQSRREDGKRFLVNMAAASNESQSGGTGASKYAILNAFSF
jgi:hypothetical protein